MRLKSPTARWSHAIAVLASAAAAFRSVDARILLLLGCSHVGGLGGDLTQQGSFGGVSWIHVLARDSVQDSYSTVADDAGAPGTAPRIAFDERWQGCVPPTPTPLERDTGEAAASEMEEDA